ncbi:hypothetical protein D9613_000071 [Agrocybe pediades]|uniref:Uncharacterized protein n=1 Tax=Agrocybe pediades TaxID=84607 RepID=A0A8H4R0P2_9AGAR|nr:hypothetical protein D9613_000071 [Agrocybe pediades]
MPQVHDDLEHTPPSTHCTLCRGTQILSGPYVARGCVHFVAVSHALAQSVTIVDDSGSPGSSTSTIELFPRNLIVVPSHMYLSPWTARYSLGRRHGILFQYNDNSALGNLILLEYDPKQELTSDYVPVVKVIPCGWVIPRSKEDISDKGAVPRPPKWHYESLFRNLLFDEGSGRVVVPFNQRFEVLDFALVYK